MRFELELWHVITLIGMLLGAYAGIAWRLLDVYTRRTDERFATVIQGVDQRFDQIGKQIDGLAQLEAKRGDQVLQLERELAALRLEMMRDFTRREDHNQAIASIRIALDNMSLRIEKAMSNGGRLDV